MKLIRLAPYNYELIILDRWRVPYAPAYGWRRVRYPYKSGDVTVLGPQVFVSEDETVINWRGVNYGRL